MHPLYGFFLQLHILSGALGLVSFWVAMALPKGGARHRRAGRAYAWTMGLSAGIAVGLSVAVLLEPSIRPGAERSFFSGLLFFSLLTLALLYRGVSAGRRLREAPGRWILPHLRGILGASVVAHTAFFVSFVPRVLGVAYERDPALNLAPWVLPPVIGLALAALVCRRQVRRFGALPRPAAVQ